MSGSPKTKNCLDKETGLMAENGIANVLEQLRHGIAFFELLDSPQPSVLTSTSSISKRTSPSSSSFTPYPHLSFARIGPPLGGESSAKRKVEHYSVQKVTGDGRCLFRALVKGMAFNKGISLNPRQERDDADELRMAVKEVICDSDKEHQQYEAALVAITVDESLKREYLIGTASGLPVLIFGAESQSYWSYPNYVVSQSQFTYQNMSIQGVDGVPALFP